jgi:hypothetical protein
MEGFPIDHLVFLLLQGCPNDPPLGLQPCLLIKCSSCTKDLLLADGMGMHGKHQIRTQLCHQAILLTLRDTMGLLTLPRWMT